VVGRRGGGGTTSSAGGVWAVGGAGGAEVRSREEEEEEDGWRRTDVSLTRDGRDRAEEEYYCGVTRSPFGATGRAIGGVLF
jgi:NaMN:DMB phosphoribosyltransferase